MQASTQVRSSKISCDSLPILRRNDQQLSPDEHVSYLQDILNNQGIYVKVDGFFGAKTEAAVKEFQQTRDEEMGAYSLTVDGIAGPQTWQALGACH